MPQHPSRSEAASHGNGLQWWSPTPAEHAHASHGGGWRRRRRGSEELHQDNAARRQQEAEATATHHPHGGRRQVRWGDGPGRGRAVVAAGAPAGELPRADERHVPLQRVQRGCRGGTEGVQRGAARARGSSGGAA
eukprot:scaffold77054_cov62-Phaeocystis_antarctica.AAC.7